MLNQLKTRLSFRTQLLKLKVKQDIWCDTHGQDLIEYALLAGFVTVTAGAIMPGIASSVSKIFSKVSSVMTNAATQGS